MIQLEILGFENWFEENANPAKLAAHGIARVTSVHKESFTISKGGGDIFAELSGNLLYSTDSPLDLPTTGDWVYADVFDEDSPDKSHAIIYGVFPRKTLLKRKTPGKQVEFQLIGANIDGAFIIQSLNDNFNLRRLERYLVMVNEAGIAPVILLSKSDLLPQQEIETIKNSINEIAPDTEVIEFSSLIEQNLDQINTRLLPQNTYCLLGSSGVGKTTLLNALIGEDHYETKSVSKIQSKGRHTTTSRQLVILESDALIIDTPGMRELGSLAVEDGLDETFAEIAELIEQCKYSDCSHTNEKRCAVLAAIDSGELSQDRFDSYQKLKRESEFNQMSYVDKRKKDKAFGKMVKSVMKNKKDSRK